MRIMIGHSILKEYGYSNLIPIICWLLLVVLIIIWGHTRGILNVNYIYIQLVNNLIRDLENSGMICKAKGKKYIRILIKIKN